MSQGLGDWGPPWPGWATQSSNSTFQVPLDTAWGCLRCWWLFQALPLGGKRTPLSGGESLGLAIVWLIVSTWPPWTGA